MRIYLKLSKLIMIITLFMTSSFTVIGAESEDLGSWETKTSMPTARQYFGVGKANGRIYVVGGDNGSKLATVEEYDPATDTWEIKASMPTARGSLGVVEANGKIYAIGGHDEHFLTTVEEYDPETNIWTTKAKMPTARSGFGVAEVNGKIYAIGGFNGDCSLTTVEEYDPETNIWTTKANIPTARQSFGVVEANGKIYAVGGYDNGWLVTVEEYDPLTDTWTTKASMSTGRNNFGIAEANGKIYVIGGYDGSILTTVEEYDPEINIWTTKTSMSTARYGLGVVETDGKIYAIGGKGTTPGYLPTVEVFIPPVTNIPAPINFTAHSSDNNITLNWAPVSDADSYTVLRSTTSSVVDIVLTDGIIDTTYIDTDIEPGVTYFYTVRAVKGEIVSEDSNIASAMVEPINILAPTNITYTVGYGSATLIWDPVEEATSYQVLRSNSTGGPYTVIAENIYTTNFIDIGLTNGNYYYYVVRAVNAESISGNSMEVKIQPGILQAPSNIMLVAGEAKITLTWDMVADADSYTIKRSTDPNGGEFITVAEGITATGFVDTNLVNETPYYYVIVAVNSTSESEDSAMVVGIPRQVSGTRVILSITMVNGMEKDYDLSQTQLVDFLNWYKEASQNNVTPYYTMTSNFNMGPYLVSKEYLIYSQILYFEMNEYSTK